MVRSSGLSSRLAPSSAQSRSAAAATGSSYVVWRLAARGRSTPIGTRRGLDRYVGNLRFTLDGVTANSRFTLDLEA